jgi:phosphohistidine swiveling domain-containing protein
MNPWVSSTTVSDVKLVGGKGLHLQKLRSWGARVAPFFVITTESYRHFLSKGEVPVEIEEKFSNFFQTHSTIALRSSMIGEDHAEASFAGLFETILDVTKDTWKENLLRIYESLHSPRVTEYLARKGLEIELMMAVVAQAQVNVTKSGVLFTRSPIEPTSAVAIDAAFGMGEGVVSGHAMVDHYQLTRSGETIKQLTTGILPVLSDEEQKVLLRVALDLEAKQGSPSDIEWGFKDGELFIFQIRPITRKFEDLICLVDTNLSESYPGTVSPFTAKFVQNAYRCAFKESALVLGAGHKRLKILDYHYKRLISCVDNHLYYNLEHYYAVLRALPGGDKNIDNWHKMIGGEQVGLRVKQHETALSNFESAKGILSLLSVASRHKRVFNGLLQDLDLLRAQIQREKSGLKSSKEIISYLEKLIERPLGFGLTIVNDVFIMLGLGRLTKVLKKKGLAPEMVIDLLKTNEGVDSLGPLDLFEGLVTELSDEFIMLMIKEAKGPGFDPYRDILDKLKDRRPREVALASEFLSKYGDRSFEELKLESLPLKNDPGLFLRLLKWAKENPSNKRAPQRQAASVEFGYLDEKCLDFTRRCIAMRESTRLWRGKFYQLIRELVLQLGETISKEDPRFANLSVLDYFSIDHEEWGRLSKDEILSLIEKRRHWQQANRQYPEMIEWSEVERLPEYQIDLESSDLKGQGVSPGIAEGPALVLDGPHEALESELKDFILVTKNTDPAWVYIMSRSKGLISEKGSLLSHTAIIGRELSVPTIVGVRSATQKIKTGDRLRIDATTGKIEVL